MNKLFVTIFDNQIPALAYPLNDIKSISFSTGATGGFIEATIVLARNDNRVYLSSFFNNYINIKTSDGYIVWEGVVRGNEQKIGQDGDTTITAVGFGSNLSDQVSS